MEAFVCPVCGESVEDVVWDEDARCWVRDMDGAVCYLTEDALVCVNLPDVPYGVAWLEELHFHR